MIHTSFNRSSLPPKIPTELSFQQDAVVVGGGPAGLMAAQQLVDSGYQVHLYDAMPSIGRKFLLAGKGGLNLTHSEPDGPFIERFGTRSDHVASWLAVFGARDVRTWAAELGVETFVGTSGRVFPVGMKAAPLLRAWLARLRAAGVVMHMRHRWCGWTPSGALCFERPDGPIAVAGGVTVLALGGASWPQLGSDAAWVQPLERAGVQVSPLGPANCGFDVGGAPEAGDPRVARLRDEIDRYDLCKGGWSEHFASRFAGAPLKSVAIMFRYGKDGTFQRRGEFVVTKSGVEGSLIYAASATLRDEITRDGNVILVVDLLPDHTPERVLAEVAHPRGSRSLSSHLKSRLGIAGVKMALLYELLSREQMADARELARSIKALRLVLRAPRPVAEAISTHGGVVLESLDAHLMVKTRASVFCCGEMLDWEAPTGGYLITASLASGAVAGRGASKWLESTARPSHSTSV